MDQEILSLLEQTKSKDNGERKTSLDRLMTITDEPVSWFEDVKGDLLLRLEDPNSFQRSLGMMLLCNLAKSSNGGSFHDVIPKLRNLLKDEKFITRRQTLQNIWKVPLAIPELTRDLMTSLEEHFKACHLDKHHNLLRSDILESLLRMCRPSELPEYREQLKSLLLLEENEKFRKDYRKILER